MRRIRKASVLAAGTGALVLSATAGASVTVSLVGDANPDELQLVISGLGTTPANLVSGFDLGLDLSGRTLTAGNMSLDLSVLDSGLGLYKSCAIGSDGSTAKGGLATVCAGPPPGGVTADLFFQSSDTDAHLYSIQDPSSAANFSLTLATLDFSAPVLPSQVTMVWGDGIHDVQGARICNAAGAVGNGADPCIIYNPHGTSVPEPDTLALFGLGLVAVALSRRRLALTAHQWS